MKGSAMPSAFGGWRGPGKYNNYPPSPPSNEKLSESDTILFNSFHP